jgi:hypothetical protein
MFLFYHELSSCVRAVESEGRCELRERAFPAVSNKKLMQRLMSRMFPLPPNPKRLLSGRPHTLQ